MSVVLSLPPPPRHHLFSRSSTPPAPRSGSSTPSRLSRPSTPPHRSNTPTPLTKRHAHTTPSTPPYHGPPMLSQPISAPPTPVTPTHLFNPHTMDRSRSSEAALGRGGRGRDPKATSLLFDGMPNAKDILFAEETAKAATEEKEWESEPMEIDGPEYSADIVVESSVVGEEGPQIWGMPKWGWEEERKEVRRGVRLVGMEEFPVLVAQHEMLDTPSHAMFPWLHGISDDGQKGRDMAAFFGHAPPFQPPPYRGLCVLLCPPHPADALPERPAPPPANIDRTTPLAKYPRERSETMSSSSASESYHSSATTEGTSPSIGDFTPRSSITKSPNLPQIDGEESEATSAEADVQMHPCEPMRVSSQAKAEGLDEEHHPLPCPGPDVQSDSSSSSDDSDEPRPSCILLNTLHVSDIFELPVFSHSPSSTEAATVGSAHFRPARLPNQINLRNLNIQQIKYASISDIVIYAKNGVGQGVLEVAESVALAQEEMWQRRMQEFYSHVINGEGEAINRPVRYGVWVVVEPFHMLQRRCAHLVNLDAEGKPSALSAETDLFEREAKESRDMTRGSEVMEGFWVGNDCDVPGGAEDGAGSRISFDLCLKASECSETPPTSTISGAYRKLLELDRRRSTTEDTAHSWLPSPATIALRNLLTPASSPGPSPTEANMKRSASPAAETGRQRQRVDHEYVTLECAGSCRTMTGQLRSLNTMTEKIVELVYFLRKIVEGRDKSGVKRRVLVHCQDGYTESSIFVLAYVMSSLSISLPEAYLHLQNNAKRSFFLYPSDKPLLRKVDARLATDRRVKASKLVASAPPPTSPNSPTSGMSRWKNWSLAFKSDSRPSSPSPDQEKKKTAEVAREMLAQEEEGGNESAEKAKVWFDDRRFDGFPSRILPFLYLGNLEHAGNAFMLHAIGITHVVSVGESLINCPPDSDPMNGQLGSNTLAAEARAGRIQVLDLTDVRDDGNDPLRPLIARACAWIEAARLAEGTVLVHCRVGVSRSASIVIAYMMQQRGMGLMDAYLMTRARRLNVLIQPNLRFFHELFGWEVQLARQEAEAASARRREAEASGVRDEAALKLVEGEQRRILYSWPTFCRDLSKWSEAMMDMPNKRGREDDEEAEREGGTRQRLEGVVALGSTEHEQRMRRFQEEEERYQRDERRARDEEARRGASRAIEIMENSSDPEMIERMSRVWAGFRGVARATMPFAAGGRGTGAQPPPTAIRTATTTLARSTPQAQPTSSVSTASAPQPPSVPVPMPSIAPIRSGFSTYATSSVRFGIPAFPANVPPSFAAYTAYTAVRPPQPAPAAVSDRAKPSERPETRARVNPPALRCSPPTAPPSAPVRERSSTAVSQSLPLQHPSPAVRRAPPVQQPQVGIKPAQDPVAPPVSAIALAPHRPVALLPTVWLSPEAPQSLVMLDRPGWTRIRSSEYDDKLRKDQATPQEAFALADDLNHCFNGRIAYASWNARKPDELRRDWPPSRPIPASYDMDPTGRARAPRPSVPHERRW